MKHPIQVELVLVYSWLDDFQTWAISRKRKMAPREGLRIQVTSLSCLISFIFSVFLPANLAWVTCISCYVSRIVSQLISFWSLLNPTFENSHSEKCLLQLRREQKWDSVCLTQVYRGQKQSLAHLHRPPWESGNRKDEEILRCKPCYTRLHESC